MTNRLPQGNRAILDVRKLEDYCLNPAHPRGINAGYSANCSAFSEAMRPGFAELFWKPLVPVKRLQSRLTLGVLTGGWT